MLGDGWFGIRFPLEADIATHPNSHEMTMWVNHHALDGVSVNVDFQHMFG